MRHLDFPWIGIVLAALFGLLLGRYAWYVADWYARLFTTHDPADADATTPPDARLLWQALWRALRHMAARPPESVDARGETGFVKIPYIPAIVLAVVYALLYARAAPVNIFVLGWAATLLLLLALIDARTRLLPDALTLPLLWTGLTAALFDAGIVPLPEALTATMIAYAALWLLAWFFLHLRGRDGMGGGDIKLLAAIGAWIGWPDVFLVLLCASVTGLCYAFTVARGRRLDAQHPFGPHLAGAAIVLLMLRALDLGKV